MALEYLASQPLAYLYRDFIKEHRAELAGSSGAGIGGKPRIFGAIIPDVQIDEASQRRYALASTGIKVTQMKVLVRDDGSGQCVVNGQPYTVFRSLMARFSTKNR